jgi:hypothetical protein
MRDFFNSPTVTYFGLPFFIFFSFFGLPTGNSLRRQPILHSSLLKKLSPPSGLPVNIYGFATEDTETTELLEFLISTSPKESSRPVGIAFDYLRRSICI